jgi:hypothetical protein
MRAACTLFALALAGAAAKGAQNDDTQLFTLTADHIKLLRNMAVTWDPTESGAPTIDPERPYGSKDLDRDIRQITGISDKRRREKLHQDMLPALQILAELGELPPGTYSCDHKLGGLVPYLEGRLVSYRRQDAPRKPVQPARIQLDFTEQHRKLLGAAVIEWNEDWADFGDRLHAVPGIDPKRPYGDMTYFEIDMAAVLGIKPAGKETKESPGFSKEQEDDLNKLHDQMKDALQVFLVHARIEPGTFKGGRYGGWERIVPQRR